MINILTPVPISAGSKFRPNAPYATFLAPIPALHVMVQARKNFTETPWVLAACIQLLSAICLTSIETGSLVVHFERYVRRNELKNTNMKNKSESWNISWTEHNFDHFTSLIKVNFVVREESEWYKIWNLEAIYTNFDSSWIISYVMTVNNIRRFFFMRSNWFCIFEMEKRKKRKEEPFIMWRQWSITHLHSS